MMIEWFLHYLLHKLTIDIETMLMVTPFIIVLLLYFPNLPIMLLTTLAM